MDIIIAAVLAVTCLGYVGFKAVTYEFKFEFKSRRKVRWNNLYHW